MNHLSSKNIVYAFDLHEVIVKPDYLKLIFYGLRHLPKTWLIAYCFWPPFLIKLLKARWHTKVPEVMFNMMSTAYPRLERIRPHFIIMSNMQKFNIPVVHLIRELKKEQYPIYLFSNIGPQTLAALRKKLPLDTLVDGYFCPQKIDDFLHKPHFDFYQNFVHFIKTRHINNPSIIFIDDKQKNIDIAKKAGLIGIKYENTFSLRKKLKDLQNERTI